MGNYLSQIHIGTNVKGSVVHDNGGVVTFVPRPLFPNYNPPDISKSDSLQAYDIGTKYEYNGKIYRYAKSYGTVAPNMGAKVKDPQETGAARALFADVAAYATEVVVVLVSPDGPAYDGHMPLNYLKGGMVVFYPAAGMTYEFTRGIIGNTEIVTGHSDLNVTLYLDAPIPFLLTTSATCEINASPWAAVCPNTSTKITDNLTSCCGVPTLRTTTGKWLWVQTKGPVWISPAASLGDNTVSNRGAWFQGDASLADGFATDTHGLQQYAGWVISNLVGGTQAAPFIYLNVE
jgi:hypothetical protein